MTRRLLVLTLLVLAAFAVTAVSATASGGSGKDNGNGGQLSKIQHLVVIYEENHSFDNLYGGWEGVNGLSNAKPANTIQLGQNGLPFSCLLQLDVNLTAPMPLSPLCDATDHFANAPFTIDDYIAATDTTCPPPGGFQANGYLKGTGLPGGCTRDIVHRFYQEQFQLDNGKQDRYALGSDAAGLVMGHYDTKKLPIYAYLHQRHHPDYAILDDFFQGAFGGSFLNHQWLVAAATPVWAGADNTGGPNDLHSIVDANGFPNSSYPLYHPATAVKDSNETVKCNSGAPAGLACGDYAVNTTQPWYQPFSPGTADARRLPPLTNTTIGDELSAKNVSWAWYSGGWSNADGVIGGPGWTNGDGPTCSDPNTIAGAVFPNCSDKLFQFHHQAFNYFYSFRPGTWARAQHLRDEQEFISRAQSPEDSCRLKSVSFVKPLGEENEHPGYSSESAGSDHLVSLLKAIESGACAKNTLVLVTYDEFGGQWDHVSPPGQGGTRGPHDQWGPGTRVASLVVAPDLRSDFVVDHTQYDTTSIAATIEQRWHLASLGTRDAAVNDLSSVFSAREAH
jgi:acid phosphatase